MSEIIQEQGNEVSLLDIAITIKENIRLLTLGPLAAGVVALGISFLIPPTFTAKTQFLPPQQSSGGMAAAMLQGLGPLGGLAGAAAGLKSPVDQYVAFLRSASVERGLVERFNLKERYESELVVDAIKSLEVNSKITSGRDGLISVEVDDADPKFAAELANGYVEELGKLLDRIAVTDAQQRRVFFEQKLQQAKEKLIVAQQKLQSSGFKEGALRAEPRAAAENYAALKAQVTSAQVRLQSMRSQMTDQAVEYKAAQAQYAALVSQLVKAETENIDQGADDYVGVYRDFKYQETLFELMAKQFEFAKLDEAREGPSIQVVDLASAPERKSKPKKGLIAILTMLATGFSLVIFVFARQAYWNVRGRLGGGNEFGFIVGR